MVKWARRLELGRALALSLRTLAVATLTLLVSTLGLVFCSYRMPLPEVLLSPERPGLRILDRNGELLARLRGEGDVWQERALASDLGPHTLAVLVAAEDARFWSHPGVDPLAMGRAAVQALTSGRIVSGASTITQQLARSCFARPRSLWGKLHEIALALRIERSLSKHQILMAYLNRVHFGPRISGMAAASDRYFGKSIAALDLGETALLMATVRGPSVYDLERHLERARERRDLILRRAAERGLVPARDVELALSTPAALRPHAPWPGAWHLSRRIARTHPGASELVTTLDLGLERRVEELTRAHQRRLAQSGASAASVVVLDTESAEVLAYVGSHDPEATRDLGQNDGVQSPRQPGSALKPFLYAVGVDELGLDAESILPDEPLTFRTTGGHYTPENYDRRFRGPVPMGRALASSLNVPAVFVLDRLGVARGLEALRSFGLASLDRDADHYGLGLSLGGGEVTLLELTGAYAALARGGRTRTARLLLTEPPNEADERQVVSAHAAALITSILRDERARAEMFGPGGVGAPEGEAPFALKTGTSTGFRDAWAFVYDAELTVGVWVGNFDGRPMIKTSGARGAAPLAVQVLVEARAGRTLPTGARPSSVARVQSKAAERGFAFTERPRILFPAEGARLSTRAPRAEVVVRTSPVPAGARLVVDGRALDPQGGKLAINLDPGTHRARLVDARGSELSSVTFEVVAPG